MTSHVSLRVAAGEEQRIVVEALRSRASLLRRAAEAGAAEIALETGDIRTPATKVVRVLGEAGILERVALALETGSEVKTSILPAAAVSKVADAVRAAGGLTEPLSPEAAATVAALAGGPQTLPLDDLDDDELALDARDPEDEDEPTFAPALEPTT